MSEKEFNRESVAFNYEEFSRIVTKDLNDTKRRSLSFIKKYKKEDIKKFLDNPSAFEKELREISRGLYHASPHYKRMIDYFANMLLFQYILQPVGDVAKIKKETAKQQYQKVANLVDNMNLRHEMIKVLKIAFREDVFYGYEHETKDAYYIQKLDPDYCAISSIEDGVFNFSFDFRFFDKYPDKVKHFAEEFQIKYALWKRDGNKEKPWIELESKNTICIKINEDIDHVIPPFAGVFEDVYDIKAYKDLRQSKEELDNYKILVQKIPIREDSDHNNDFLIDFENVMAFHNKASKSLPDQVGLITTPMDVEEFSFERKNSDADNVAKAERDLWSAVGVSQLLFNTDKSSTLGLAKSIQTDEEILFAVLRQIERWTNRKVKNSFSNSNYFRVNMLDITIFNRDEFFEKVLQASQFGLPVKSMVGASLGLTPSALMNMAYLENDVLEMHENFIPLVSSHTQTGDEAVGGKGRPAKKDKDLSSEGARSKDKPNKDK